MLDDLPPHILKRLTAFVNEMQSNKNPTMRNSVLESAALSKYEGLVNAEDEDLLIPFGIPETNKELKRREYAQISSAEPRLSISPSQETGKSNPVVSACKDTPDDIFPMDEDNAVLLPKSVETVLLTSTAERSIPWKAPSTLKFASITTALLDLTFPQSGHAFRHGGSSCIDPTHAGHSAARHANAGLTK